MKALILFILLIFCSCSNKHNSSSIVLLVSFDGFRYDYMNEIDTPNFDFLKVNGVKAESLAPIFPSFTFPNHYAIATGCYSDKHKILANIFYDFRRKELYSYKKPTTVQDGSWYGCEPIWSTVEKNNMKSASYFWVGSEAEIKGFRPSIYKKYKNGVNPYAKVDTVINWLDENKYEEIPSLITLYFNEPDHAGHVYGPYDNRTKLEIARSDSILGYLLNSINTSELKDRINIIVVSDHGMEEVSNNKIINIRKYIDENEFDIYDNGPIIQLYSKDVENMPYLTTDMIPNVKIFTKQNLPDRFRFKTYNTGDYILLADSGWMMYDGDKTNSVKGMHGYDPKELNMHGIFYAYGPKFNQGQVIDTFELIHIYPLICKILNISPYSESDGDINVLEGILK